MNTEERNGYIRIVKTPAGEAPLEIRKAWVGLVLPCDPFFGYPDSADPERGVVSGKAELRNRPGFSVEQDAAIAILERHAPEAAEWWRGFGFPRSDCYFCFSESEAEIASGVTRQKIVHVTEEMMGDPNR
jgi:hypothetical protein